ncbi:hypothetical protein MRX96_005134 [Rhipicephalus microplus]
MASHPHHCPLNRDGGLVARHLQALIPVSLGATSLGCACLPVRAEHAPEKAIVTFADRTFAARVSGIRGQNGSAVITIVLGTSEEKAGGDRDSALLVKRTQRWLLEGCFSRALVSPAAQIFATAGTYGDSEKHRRHPRKSRSEHAALDGGTFLRM